MAYSSAGMTKLGVVRVVGVVGVVGVIDALPQISVFSYHMKLKCGSSLPHISR